MFPRKILHLRLPVPITVCLAFLLSACDKPAEKVEDVRPVRAIVVNPSNVEIDAEFAGEVRARVESRLAFRVPGKITLRKVDVGSVVHKGQVLMQLDPEDLRLNESQAKAALRAAETTRDLAKAELKRYQELRVKNFVSQAVLDAKLTGWTAAQANVDAAQAAYFGTANQAGYASLVADIDGVVTAVDAEVGQVVAPGTPVVRVAKSGEMEIVIGLPEDKVEIMRKVQDVGVRLWAKPNVTLPGRIREIAPVADALTRTYAVKVAIPADAPEVRLGMTASVQFSSKSATPLVHLPLTAMFYEKAITSVWIVANGAVHLSPVEVVGISGNDVVLASGVKPGETVVTAGANVLKNGQKVTVLAAEIPASANSASTEVVK
ncbi:MAG: efflux RND transporter periplasmic adaptor subunit [Pseudomonadota bacterium]